MKRAFGMLFFVLFAACNTAPTMLPQTNFDWKSDIVSAQQRAQTENKLLLLEFSTEWCPYCRHIEQRIMPQNNVASRLRAMVLVRVDGDRAEAGPLMEQYKVEGYPTFIVLNSSGEELRRFTSVSSTEEFLQNLTTAGSNAEQDLLSQLDQSEDTAQKIELAQQALQLYPQSAQLPRYYAELARAFHSTAISRSYWMSVVKLVRERLNRLDKQSEAIVRVTLDEHVDLLAEAYQKIAQFDEVQPLYAEAARASQQLIEDGGGIAQNEYLLGTTVYFYTQSGDVKRALHFLRDAAKVLPNYWPVHASFGKVYALKGDFAAARAAYAKAYDLAEEVAKTRVALAWADVCVRQGELPAAFEILQKVTAEMQRFGGATAGRAKVMLERIEKQKKEYETYQKTT